MVAGAATPSRDGVVLTDRSGSGMVMVSRWRKDSSKPTASSAMLSASSASRRGTSHPPFDVRLAASAYNHSLSDEIPLRSVFRDVLLAQCLVDNPPSDPQAKLSYAEGNQWVLDVLGLPQLTPALEDSLFAVSIAVLGHRASRTDLMHESLKLYTKGLAALRRDILDPSKRDDAQSLAACLASLLY